MYIQGSGHWCRFTESFAQYKLSDVEKCKFRMECLEFLSATADKIVERSPLKYSIVRAISCFVPSRVASKRFLSEKRLAELVQILYEKNHITSVVADSAKLQFSNLCARAGDYFSGAFERFSRHDHHLDFILL